MRCLIIFSLILGGTWQVFSGTHFEECGWETCACKKNLFDLRSQFEARKGERPPGNGRQYARDRLINVTHQKIDFTPNFKERTLSGIATTQFAPIAKPLESLRLDAVDLTVQKVESSHPIESWNNDDKGIDVIFKKPIPTGENASVTIHYSAQPQDGLFFRTEAMGYPVGDDHFWTQGEPEKHRHWFPGYDFPNERFTTEVICHVPEDMVVLSNGTLISDTVTNQIRTTHWHQQKEHVNYLISVIAGHFKKLEAKHGEVPLAFYTTPSHFSEAENSFRDTAKILAFLESEIGVPYPWAKYDNVCVADFVAGGMENTSITTLTTGTLFTTASENLHSSHRLDAHEATHQWFGDLLTCKDWSNLWLNEGFATYYTHLYDEHKSGRDEMLYGLFSDSEGVLGNKDDKPIVWRGFTDPWEQFDYRAYPKGSWVLHMLRSKFGPELYRKCIKTYVERHQFKNVETNDLKAVFEELTGQSLDEFFDQWVFHGGVPLLDVVYNWDGKAKKVQLTIKQTQKVSEKVLLFDFDLPIRFVDEANQVHNQTVRIQQASEDFSFALPSKPQIVRIDPDLTVLARINFRPPSELIHNQLNRADDMMGRLLAIASLRDQANKKSEDLLKKHLNQDAFYGVRIEAARVLAAHQSENAYEILKNSLKQTDARVRLEVVRAIGDYFSPDAHMALTSVVTTEKNPEIVAAAIRAIGKYPFSEVSKTLEMSLERDSYRHHIAMSAIRAIRKQGDPTHIPVLKKHLEAKQSRFSTNDLGDALEVIGYLSRDAERETRAEVLELLSSMVNHPNPEFRRHVFRAMGALQDQRAVPILQPFAQTDDDDEHHPTAKAASEAIKEINSGKKQADEVRDLRDLVFKLQKKLDRLGGKAK
jgi:aminopeptidase N